MSYTVLLEHRAERELRELPQALLKSVDRRLRTLATNPRPPGATMLKGKEVEGWRLRVGDYRILYTIDDSAQLVRVYRIKHRREVYR